MTTHAIREELQRSKATLKELSTRYNLNPKTVLKWKHRETVQDSPIGPKRVRTVLTEKEEAIIGAFRQKTQLPLDDCYIALKKYIPALSRSNLHRCLKRFGLSRLPKHNKKPDKNLSKSMILDTFILISVKLRQVKAELIFT